MRSVPMGGLFWWEGDAVYSVFFPILVMAVFIFPVYDKKEGIPGTEKALFQLTCASSSLQTWMPCRLNY